MATRNKKNENQRNPQELENMIGKNLSFGAAEAYKLLRTNLEFSLPDKSGCKVIGITSSVWGEGKSTTAINLAYTMAQTGNNVLLLEADMRLPTLGKRLGLKPAPGISNLLVGQCSGNDAVQRSQLLDNLRVMTAGDLPPNPAELLGSQQMRIILQTLAKVFDVIILDLPPITAVTDALIVSQLVNGMVLVVRQNYCDRSALNESIRQLKFAKAKILGMVMTDANTQSKSYRRSNYYKKELDA